MTEHTALDLAHHVERDVSELTAGDKARARMARLTAQISAIERLIKSTAALKRAEGKYHWAQEVALGPWPGESEAELQRRRDALHDRLCSWGPGGSILWCGVVIRGEGD